MGVTQQQLEKLKEPMDYKYRLQSAKYGKATIVSYCDSRQIQDRFDEVCGQANWKNEFQVIGDNLFCGISVKCKDEDGNVEWVTKWDVGTESNMEAEKGNASSAIKRSAVLWQVGRFLYSLGIITLKAVTHTNSKDYPATDEGNILWTVEEVTEYCKKVVESGELDRTKKGIKPLGGNKPTTNATPVNKVTPTTTKKDDSKPVKAPATLTDGKGLQPNTNFDKPEVTEEATRRAKALELYKKLDAAVVLKATIKAKEKYTNVEEFVNNAPIDKVLEIYGQLTAK